VKTKPLDTPASRSPTQEDYVGLDTRQPTSERLGDDWPCSSERLGRRLSPASLGWCLLVVVASGVAVYAQEPLVATCGGLLALVFLPGLALVASVHWRDSRLSLGEVVLLAGAIGAAWLVLTTLVLALLRLQLGLPLLVFADFIALGLPLSAVGRGRAFSFRPTITRPELVQVALILAFAVPFRFANLGYTEFQGDESEVVLRALGVVQNLPDVLFYHGKGPAELLVTAALYSLGGQLTEASARLPFAVFNVVGILGLAAVVNRWFGAVAGLAAGLLLALNGYFIAFAHIAQYQSLVFMFSVAAIACAERYRASARDARWAVLAGLMIGTGTLAHYDALFAGPLAAGLIVLGLRMGGTAWRRAIPGLVAAVAVGTLAALLFFGPYLASPLIEYATERLSGRIGDDFPRNNLPTIVPAVNLYLSAYYALALLALAAVGLMVGLLRPPVRVRSSMVAGRRLVVAVTLWTMLPLLTYVMVVRKPGTHIHVALEGVTVLAAVGAAAVAARPWFAGRIRRALLIALAFVALSPVLAYHYTFFVVTQPEVVRSGLATEYPLYLAIVDPSARPGENLVPRKERFGFPYQAGWKAVGVLFADGRLQGSYDSNENPQITHWYTRDAWRCTAEPRYYLIAEDVQDEIEPPRRKIAAEYSLVADVTVGGRPKLHVYDHERQQGAPAVYAAEDLAARFDRDLSGPSLDPGRWARGPVAARPEQVGADFGEARLLGYRLYPEAPRAGGFVRLDLFWLPSVDGGGRDAVVRLGRGPVVGDGSGPGCDHSRSWEEWRVGRPFVQRHSIRIAESAAPGAYPLVVGMNSAPFGGMLPITGGPWAGQTLVEIAQIDLERKP
jgi:hypothetical protein